MTVPTHSACLSSSMYSPLRGLMVKLSSPIRRATSSAYTPAALTTYLALTEVPSSNLTVNSSFA